MPLRAERSLSAVEDRLSRVSPSSSPSTPGKGAVPDGTAIRDQQPGAPAQAASLIAVASSTTLAKRSAWCRAISVTTDPPLCVPAAVALRADLQRPEKLGILVLRIGVVQMRRGQKLIRPDLGEGAMRLRIPQVTRHGPSWGAGWWGAGRLAACHCCLQHPNLTAINAGPFHHAAITKRPQHVYERTPCQGADHRYLPSALARPR
jgi:hypothetical protein